MIRHKRKTWIWDREATNQDNNYWKKFEYRRNVPMIGFIDILEHPKFEKKKKIVDLSFWKWFTSKNLSISSLMIET